MGASKNLFLDLDEENEKENDEFKNDDNGSEKCLTPIQKLEEDHPFGDDESSLELETVRPSHSTRTVESKYEEDIYANGCDKEDEEVWLVDKDTWDLSSDEENTYESKEEENCSAVPAALTVDHSSWDSSDEEGDETEYEQKKSN